jgi:hypothetical protein
MQRYSGKLEGDGKTYINYAVQSAERLEALISSLGEFWQLSEQGAEPLTPIDCNQVVKTVLHDLEALISESGAVVTVDPLPSVMGSEIQITQLFQNLVGNAIKYRTSTTPTVHIFAEKNSAEWLFSIEDNGVGIDSEYSVQIFQVFKRLHTSSKYPGSGIGLAICQKIVERYGGKIWVEPNSTGGSTFKFTIPSA